MSGGRKKRKGNEGPSKQTDRMGKPSKGVAGQRSNRATAPRSHVTPPDTPIEINGWQLYTWAAFRERWSALVAAVEKLRERDPDGYKRHPESRFLAMLRKVVLEDIPRDPADARYRLGKTMGGDHAHWRRAKFGRFRLFFRYHSKARIIAYVWLNDEHTLRKAESRTDVYATFKSMLENDRPPSDWEELLEACETWGQHEPQT